MSKATRQRPSQVMQISDELVAYAVDTAVVLWGTAFDNAVQTAASEAKTQEEAQKRAARTARRWIPELRKR